MFDKKKPTKSFRITTSLETRHVVWKFWHDKSTHSTLMSRPARLKVSDKGKTKTSLDCFHSEHCFEQKRNIFLWEFMEDYRDNSPGPVYKFHSNLPRLWSCLWNIPSLEAILHKRSNKLRSWNVLLQTAFTCQVVNKGLYSAMANCRGESK